MVHVRAEDEWPPLASTPPITHVRIAVFVLGVLEPALLGEAADVLSDASFEV
jgi:hypothetical protein